MAIWFYVKQIQCPCIKLKCAVKTSEATSHSSTLFAKSLWAQLTVIKCKTAAISFQLTVIKYETAVFKKKLSSALASFQLLVLHILLSNRVKITCVLKWW